MEIPMRGKLLWILTAVLLGFTSPSFALDSGIDCAEGADEDLVSETQTVEPAPTTPPSKTS
jgi:hypothetical protein